MNPVLRHALRAASRSIARWAGQSYVAGPELGDALGVCRRLSRQGVASTVCFWNTNGEDPARVAAAYRSALQRLTHEALDCYLSVKAPALGYRENALDQLVGAARGAEIGIHFDALRPETATASFALIEHAALGYDRIGCTLPGRWLRSLDDAARAIDLGLRVRVVKGQWPDPAQPERDLRAGFLALVERLAGRARRVAVATHDPLLAQQALSRLRDAGTPCELELLFGLPLKPSVQAARGMGVPVRVYVPYGEAWLPYCFSQLRSHPHLLWWIARDTLLGRTGKLTLS